MLQVTAIPQGDAGKMTDAELYSIAAREMGWEDDAPEQATETPIPSEPTEELEAELPKEDEETEQEETEVQKEEEPTEEKWLPKNLDELAEALEVDGDALKAIKIKTKVDGVEADVPLGEVIKNYQLNKALTERSEALAHEKKAFEEVSNRYLSEYQTRIEEFGAWQGILEERLKEQVASVDWQQLREDDPAEYAAKRQEFTERIAEIEWMKASMQQHRQVLTQQQQQQYVQKVQELVKENAAKLPTLIPEYKDEEFRKSDMKNIKNYLISFGFGEDELKTVVDARQVALARKAMLYDKMQREVEPKVKMVKDKPKFIKPSARTTVEDRNVKEADKAYKKALKSQHTDDWVNVLINRL